MALAKNSFFLFVSNIYFQLIGYVATFFLARYLGVSKAGLAIFGSYVFLIMVVNMITSIADMGMSTAFEKEIASETNSKKVVGTYMFYRIIAMSLSGVVIVMLYPYISTLFGISDLFAITLAAIIPVAWTPTRIFARMHIAKGNAMYSQVPNIIENTLRTIFVAYSAVYIKTLNSLLISYFIASLIVGILSLVLLSNHLKGISLDLMVNMLKYATPIGMGIVVSYFVQNIDNFFVIAFLSSSLLALYNTSKSFYVMLSIIPSILMSNVFPYFVRHIKNQGNEGLAEKFLQIQRYLFLFLAPLALIVIVYRVNLLHILYSNRFITVSPEVVVFTLTIFPMSLSYLYSTLFNSLNKQKLPFYISALQLAIVSVLAYALITRYGLIGGALAVFLSYVVIVLIYITIGYKIINVYPNIKSLYLILFASIITFFSLSFINRFVAITRWYNLIGVGIIGIGIYFVLLILSREFKKEDIEILLGSFGFSSKTIKLIQKIFIV